MTRRLLFVVGIPTLIGAMAAVPLGLTLGPNQWVFAAIGFGLCVPPGLAVMLLHDYLSRTSPFGRIMAMFAGALIRLAVGFGGGAIVFFLMGLEERADKIAFWGWILFAYLTTLVVETVVFARPHAASRFEIR